MPSVLFFMFEGFCSYVIRVVAEGFCMWNNRRPEDHIINPDKLQSCDGSVLYGMIV